MTIPGLAATLSELATTYLLSEDAHAQAVEEYLSHAAQHPGIVHLDPEVVWADARALRARAERAAGTRADGEIIAAHVGLPLFGIPTPIKDLTPQAGRPITFGSARRATVADTSDPIVDAFVRAGGLVAGSSHTSEMGLSAYCEPVGFEPVPGFPDPGRTPGGSSGGAALAVASGLTPLAQGTDGGGSLRVPAAACGVVGFKPAHDSRGGRLTAAGFITRTVADAVYAAGACGLVSSSSAVERALGVGKRSPASALSSRGVLPPVGRLADGARRLRVGVLVEPLHGDGGRGSVAAPWAHAVLRAADVVANAGHEVVELGPPYGPAPFEAFSTILAFRSRNVSSPASPLVEWLIERGQSVTQAQFAAAVEVFEDVPRMVKKAWDVDVVLTPTLAFDPPQVGAFSSLAPEEDFLAQTRWTPWCTLFNILGASAISVPCAGRSVQVGAVWGADVDVFAVARLLEGVQG